MVRSQTQCTVYVSELTAAPFNLISGDEIYAVVYATNTKGDSATSVAGNNATILGAPDAPIELQEDTSQRETGQLGFSWNKGASDGGAIVIDYRISIAESGGTFAVLDSAVNTEYVVTGLTAGITYELKVEARNQLGYSPFSDTLSLLCAYIPFAPTDVLTEMS